MHRSPMPRAREIICPRRLYSSERVGKAAELDPKVIILVALSLRMFSILGLATLNNLCMVTNFRLNKSSVCLLMAYTSSEF